MALSKAHRWRENLTTYHMASREPYCHHRRLKYSHGLTENVTCQPNGIKRDRRDLLQRKGLAPTNTNKREELRRKRRMRQIARTPVAIVVTISSVVITCVTRVARTTECLSIMLLPSAWSQKNVPDFDSVSLRSRRPPM